MRQHPTATNPRRWGILRRRILNRDGWRCRTCGKAGRLEVDHVIPVQAGGDWWDPANLQTLCRPCHFAKTATENANPDSPERAEWRAFMREAMRTPATRGGVPRSPRS